MPDAPDSFRYTHITTFTPSVDVNELAAKLGSPATLFREGQIVYQNDFRDGIKGISISQNPPDSTIYLDSNHTTLTGMSLFFKTTLDFDLQSSINKKVPVFNTRYYIIGAMFAVSSGNGRVTFQAIGRTNDIIFELDIRFDYCNQIVYYYGTDAAYHELAIPGFIGLSTGANHRFSLKIDTDNFRYAELIIDEIVFDMSDIDCWSMALPGQEYLSYTINHSSLTGAIDYLYLNSLIVACTDA